MLELNTLEEENDIASFQIPSIQGQLLEMGYELKMINAIFKHFHIESTYQALFYLSKKDELWNHPFIPSKENNDNSITSKNPSVIVHSVLSKIISPELFCDICGESPENHREQLQSEHPLSRSISIFSSFNNRKRNKSKCPICLDSILDTSVIIENCNHKICLICLSDYIIDKIKRNNIDNIHCPIEECNNVKLSEEFIFKYINEEHKKKYNVFKLQNEIARDPNKIFCPLCTSYAIAPKKPNKKTIQESKDNEEKQCKKILICVENKHKFCSCGRPCHEGKCYKDEKELKEFMQKYVVKKCPKCGFLIEKKEGCNHMICGNPTCNYQFCWLCLQEYFSDHYEYGDCKGKQFSEDNKLQSILLKDEFEVTNDIKREIQKFLEIILIVLIIPVALTIINYSEKSRDIKNKIAKYIYLITLFCIMFSLLFFLYSFGFLFLFGIIIFQFFCLTKFYIVNCCCKSEKEENGNLVINEEDFEIEDNSIKN